MDLERFRWMDVVWIRFSSLKRMLDGSFQHSERFGHLTLPGTLRDGVHQRRRRNEKFFERKNYRLPVLVVCKNRDMCGHIA